MTLEVKVFIVEGKDEVYLILGLLRITDSKDIRKRNSKAKSVLSICSSDNCYLINDNVILLNANGKDNVSKLIRELERCSKEMEIKLHVLLDKDAEINLQGVDTKILEHKNLDELIVSFIFKKLREQLSNLSDKEKNIIYDLINLVKDTEDSKQKELLAEFLAKRYILPEKKWEDKRTFLKILGVEYHDMLLNEDKSLKEFVTLLKREANMRE